MSASARELPPLPAKYTAAGIDAAFALYLRKSPFVMELGGAVLVELAPTRWAVVGVAKTVLKDDSATELLRAGRVCALKAKAAIVAKRDGAQITYLKRVRKLWKSSRTGAGRRPRVSASARSRPRSVLRAWSGD